MSGKSRLVMLFQFMPAYFSLVKVRKGLSGLFRLGLDNLLRQVLSV
jgi:hypothetical protein